MIVSCSLGNMAGWKILGTASHPKSKHSFRSASQLLRSWRSPGICYAWSYKQLKAKVIVEVEQSSIAIDWEFFPGTMYLYPNAMSLTSGTNTMNALTNTGSVPLIRKRRPVGRRRRSMFISADSRNDTNLYSEELLASPDPAEMYNVMIQCAEDYTKLYFIQ